MTEENQIDSPKADWLDLYLDGDLSESQAQLLVNKLKQDPAYRETFLAQLAIHNRLGMHNRLGVHNRLGITEDTAKSDPVDAVIQAIQLQSENQDVAPAVIHQIRKEQSGAAYHTPETSNTPATPETPDAIRFSNFSNFSSFSWPLTAAATLLLGLFIGTMIQTEDPNPTPPISSAIPDSDSASQHIATINQTLAPRWADGQQYQRGDALPAEWVSLAAGRLQITLNKATLAIQGPAKFKIESPERIHLAMGSISVHYQSLIASPLTIMTKHTQIKQTGDGFCLEAMATGNLQIQNISGDVALTHLERTALSPIHFSGKQSVLYKADKHEIERVADLSRSFEPIHWQTLKASSPIRLQFDCGYRAGLYHGRHSPAHQRKDLRGQDRYWNQIVSDITTNFITSDGSLCPYPIQIEIGAAKDINSPIDWSLGSDDKEGGPQGRARGLFDSEMGKDGLHHLGAIALQLKGLPKGTYRLYLLTRSGAIRKNGDHLRERAYQTIVDMNQNRQTFNLLTRQDAEGKRWRHGHTHIETEIQVASNTTPITIMSAALPDYSVDAKGWRGIILGFQIIQLPDE